MQDLTQEEFKQIEKDFQDMLEKQKQFTTFNPSPRSNRTLELMQDIQKNLHFIQPK